MARMTLHRHSAYSKPIPLAKDVQSKWKGCFFNPRLKQMKRHCSPTQEPTRVLGKCSYLFLNNTAWKRSTRNDAIKELTVNTANCGPQTAVQAPVLHLSPAEELLRQLLLACHNSIVSSRNDVTNLDMWFVGGWVRDRLLDRQSSDIDVALSSMTGIQFGHALEHYLESEKPKYIEEAKRLGVPPVISQLHEIKKNSEKSKHLETGHFHSIFGLSVDFVNLRKESYSKESRIPQMEFGSPEEDAHRRDATINALFYNLKTAIVEDHTGHGLYDLAAGVIRTPSCPFMTFDDDPLRILRLIRIAAQLGFRIEQETMNAMRHVERPEQLCTKVSRPRVEAELRKILKGPNTLSALQLIHELHLYEPVFFHEVPVTETASAIWLLRKWSQDEDEEAKALLRQWSWKAPCESHWARAFETVAFLLNEGPNALRNILLQPENIEDVWMLTAFVPDRPVWDYESAMRAAKVPEIVSRSMKNEDAIHDYMCEVNGDFNGDWFSPVRLSRGTLGAFIRVCGRSWRLQVLYALLQDDVWGKRYGKERLAKIERWSRFVEYISEQRLENAPYIKPILNGHDILSLYGREKGGPMMQDGLNDLMEWQFDHEDATKEEAMEWMLTRKEMYPF